MKSRLPKDIPVDSVHAVQDEMKGQSYLRLFLCPLPCRCPALDQLRYLGLFSAHDKMANMETNRLQRRCSVVSSKKPPVVATVRQMSKSEGS